MLLMLCLVVKNNLIDFKFSIWGCCRQLSITTAILFPLDVNFRSYSRTHSSNKTPSILFYCWILYRQGKNLTFLKQRGILRIFQWQALVSYRQKHLLLLCQLCHFYLAFHLSTSLIWVGLFCWLHICKTVQTRQSFRGLSFHWWTIKLVVRFLFKR